MKPVAPVTRNRQMLRNEVERIRSVYTLYPKLEVIRQDVVDLLHRDNSASQGNVQLLLGKPGAGKTKLLEDLKASFPRQPKLLVNERGDTADHAPLVVASVPDATSKGVAESLYEAFVLVHPSRVFGARYNRNRLVQECIRLAREMQTKLLVLDEAHQSVDDETDRVAAEIAVTIKTMVNAKQFSVLVVGTEEARRLVDAKAELARRTSKVTTIEPFGPTGEDRDVWLEILGDYDDRLSGVFGCQSGLDTPAIAEQLRIASDGFVGRMAALVEEAALLAVDDMLRDTRIRPGVQVAHLESAFDAWALARPERNPFRIDCSPSKVVSRAPGSSVLRDDDTDQGQRSGVRGVQRSNARDASFRK